MPKKGEYKQGAKKRSVQQRKFNSKPAEKKRRAARNKARAQAQKAGKVRKGDGKDVGHKKPLARGGSTSKKNTRVEPRSKNRAHGGRIGNRKAKGRGK